MSSKLENLYCARCGSEFDINIRRTTGYSGPLHLPNLFCPFCGTRRVTKKQGMFFKIEL
jgi:DNA-directed RNA polymerase subunit RPC12/RpoP